MLRGRVQAEAGSPTPCALLPCSKTCVMVHRSPDSADAVMTMMKPARLNSASPYTSKMRPTQMMAITTPRLALGLHMAAVLVQKPQVAKNLVQAAAGAGLRNVRNSMHCCTQTWHVCKRGLSNHCMYALGAGARAGWQDSPLEAPSKAEEEEKHWRGGFAHGVE